MVYLQMAVVAVLVGALYGLLGVRSPAPPFIAIIGLGGMLATSMLLGAA